MSEWNGQFNARLQRLEKKAAEGGGGGELNSPISGKCTLTKTGLAESYNDLLSMLSKGFIPFYKYPDGFIWICSSCDVEGEGIIFKRISDNNVNKIFVYEDSPDDPLIFD